MTDTLTLTLTLNPGAPPAMSRPPALNIAVRGVPAGQGQLSFLGKGRGARHTNEKSLKPWRRAIVTAATMVAGTHPYAGAKGVPTCPQCGRERKRHGLLDGPLAVHITVTVEQSKASAKRGDLWPDNNTTTDIDHHARAELDALTEAAVWHDDGQVAYLSVAKVFPVTPYPGALSEPGAVIRIWRLT